MPKTGKIRRRPVVRRTFRPGLGVYLTSSTFRLPHSTFKTPSTLKSAACYLALAAAPNPTPTRLCAIDLGTNSFHALIVDAYPTGAFEVLDQVKDRVELGRDGLATLSDAAFERGLAALGRIRQLADGWQVEGEIALATSAIREAANGRAFVRRAKEETGFTIQPISGDLEALLIYKGVRRALGLSRPSLLVDIGGGSTEFVVATEQVVFFKTSLKLGAARTMERFVTTDPISDKEKKALRAFYRETMAPVFEAAREFGAVDLVGSSGTLKALGRLCGARHLDEAELIFTEPITPKTFGDTLSRTIKSSEKERREAGVDETRLDQLATGALLVETLLDELDFEQVRISPDALREGIVLHYIEQNPEQLEAHAPSLGVRGQSVRELAVRCRWDERHAQQVAALALHLFDATAEAHELGQAERELLEHASLLHDIGYHVSRRAHHKHSQYLIEHADLRGFSEREVQVMANVARYHRRSHPKDRHDAYDALGGKDQKLVCTLASLLRLAEGLDRSHYQNVTYLARRSGQKDLALEHRHQGRSAPGTVGHARGRELVRGDLWALSHCRAPGRPR